MKRKFYFLMLLLIPICGMSQTFSIPDANFRSFLKTSYPGILDANDELIIQNAAGITGSVGCNNLNISSLEGIQYFTSISGIFFQDNNISTLPDISGLTGLKYFYGQNNKLISLPSFNNLGNLLDLILYNNQLSSLPDFSNLVNLQNLNVSDNKLTSFPDLTNTVSLQNINVGNNLLTSFPQVNHLQNLTDLYLYNNRISAMVSLDHMAALKNINLGQNQITVFPDITGSNSIQVIECYMNMLTSAPDFSSYNLITLDFYDNQLAELKGLHQGLQNLYIGKNKFKSLPDLSSITSLTKLSCFSNELEVTPDLHNLINLQILSFGTNKLVTPPDVSTLTKLTSLVLDNNYFTNLPDLSNVPDLTEVNVCNNYLSFEDLKPLTTYSLYSSFAVFPQKEFLIQEKCKAVENNSFSFDPGIRQNANDIYKWYRSDTLYSVSSSPELLLSSAAYNESAYYYLVVENSSPAFTGKQIKTSRVFVQVVPAFITEKHISLTPDGDHQNDEFYIEDSGTISIYSSEGVLLKTLVGPAIWDATDQSGKLVNPGVYLVVSGQNQYKISVILK